LPSGLSIDPNQGIISGTVGLNAAQNSVTITATDSTTGASTNVTMNWTVQTPLLVMVNPGNQTNAVGNTVSLPVSAAATDGAAPTFTATGLPDGLSIDPNSGIISGTIASDAGTSTVTITATDPSTNVSVYVTITWTIGQAAPLKGAGTGGGGGGGYEFIIDIPIIDPLALPQPMPGTTNGGDPWAIYGWIRYR